MKKWFTLLLIAVIGLLAACGAETEESAESDTTAAKTEQVSKDTVYTKVKEAGVVEVGATSTGPPFTFLNTSTGEIDGYMIDVAKYIGEELDLTMNVNTVQWASLIPSVDSGKINMIAAAMAATDERREVLDFSDIVYSYGETIIVPKGTTDVKTIDDLVGKKIGVQEASIYYNGVNERSDIDFQTYKTHQDMAKELQNGRIDAFFADYPIFKQMLKELPDLAEKVEIVQPEEILWEAEIAIAVPKDTPEFLDAINEALAEMEKSGAKEEFIEKWELN